ncbi:hypothetical protein FEZ34_05595 [Lacticaseibacillus casei]|nr:hypothetical protein FEZ34_05595 [Lacticaseibacillus casei]
MKGGCFMDLNSLLRQKAEEILRTKGVQVTCPNCKQKFLAKSMLATCPHCGKSFNVEFKL